MREITPGSAPFASFLAALEQAGLPTDDLTSEPFRYFVLDDAAWGGIGAGADALIRSIVVTPEARAHGFGTKITEALVHRARADGVERLWLLTTNASPFFAKLGWREAERSAAPGAIARSRQFAEVCPASAILMVRTL